VISTRQKLAQRRCSVPHELLSLDVEVSLNALFELGSDLGAVGGGSRGHFSWRRQGSSYEAENSEGLHFRVFVS
jgi:hypothetical protein